MSSFTPGEDRASEIAATTTSRADVSKVREYEIHRAKEGKEYDPWVLRLCDLADSLRAENEQLCEDAEARVARLRAAATDVRLRDAQTVGDLLDDAREALEAAYAEFERAEEHHRWHHEQEGREVEPDEERLRVLMVIAEALDSLGANDD